MMQKKGNIADEMMYNTYNMGLGMCWHWIPQMWTRLWKR